MKKYNSPAERQVRIEVKRVTESVVVCNLFANETCVEIMIKRVEYDQLQKEGFFERAPGESDVFTTGTYKLPVLTTTA